MPLNTPQETAVARIERSAHARVFSPRDRQPEVEGDDITVVVAAVRNKQTTRWRMRR